MAIQHRVNDKGALSPEGMGIKNYRPDTKGESLERIADSLEKLVELQTPKETTWERVSDSKEASDLAEVIADNIKTQAILADKAGKKMGEELRKLYTGIERDAEGNAKGFKPGGYTGDSKTQVNDFLAKLNEEGAEALKNGDEKPKDWRADTTELQREKNKLAVRIAEIEKELKRRDQK